MDAVDSQVTVTTVWKKNGIALTSLSRRKVLDTILSNSSSYISQVVFEPFEIGSDDGAYSCEVTIEAQDDGRYILSAVLSSDNITLIAEGIIHVSFYMYPYHYFLYSSHTNCKDAARDCSCTYCSPIQHSHPKVCGKCA